MEIHIGDFALLAFIDDSPEENQLKAIFSLDLNDNLSTIKNNLKNIESRVWIQIGENERIFGDVILDSSCSDNEGPKNWVLKFDLSSLMSKELVGGQTLFSGVEHQNYNVRTQEIPILVSKSIAQIIDK
tara:strand:+ start:164 stop:550 length:387 start_codon:yes stop_codon:yes gene_type:complete